MLLFHYGEEAPARPGNGDSQQWYTQILSTQPADADSRLVNPDSKGPLDEYDERVHSRRLRDDEHQRSKAPTSPYENKQLTSQTGLVQYLQDLHDMLMDYETPKVVHPSISSLKPHSESFFSSLFHRKPTQKLSTQIPPNLPKGLYMYGDVGSGKTMLMDMFYDTLPHNITSKTRIHFHNFMQDVHKRLHAMKSEHGTDLDAILYVAADIAEKSSILCFDEFQCTDVADAMILRRQAQYQCCHQKHVPDRGLQTSGSLNDSRGCPGHNLKPPPR